MARIKLNQNMSTLKKCQTNRRNKLKKVTGYFNKFNKTYVQRELLTLQDLGINTESVNSADLSKHITTPMFVVTKNNGIISKLIGKYSAGHLSSWIQNYIKVN